MDQPTGGGAAITQFFSKRPQGAWLQLQVTRDLVHSDVQHQQNQDGTLQYFKTGGQPDYNRPKLVLIMKCTVLQSSDNSHQNVFQDGTASVWLKGTGRDAFVAAMSAAGVPDASSALGRGKLGGAIFTMQSAGERASNRAGYNPTKLYNFTYTPNGRESIVDAPAIPPTASAPATAVVTPTAPAPPPAPQMYAQDPSQLPPTAPPAAPPMAAPPNGTAPLPLPPGYPTALPAAAPTVSTYAAPNMQPAVPAPPAGVPGVPPVPTPPLPPGYPPSAVPPGYAPPMTPEQAEKNEILAQLQGQQP